MRAGGRRSSDITSSTFMFVNDSYRLVVVTLSLKYFPRFNCYNIIALNVEKLAIIDYY